MNEINIIEKVFPFNKMDKGQLNRILGHFIIKSYRKGKYINYQGDKVESVNFILQGSVILYKWIGDNKERNLREIGIGEWFNLSEAISRDFLHYDSRANENSIILSSPVEKLEIILNNEIINRSIIQSLTSLNCHYNYLISNDSCLTSVIRFINNQSNKTISITQDELSVKLGYTRESINKNLKKLESENIIELKRGKIIKIKAE